MPWRVWPPSQALLEKQALEMAARHKEEVHQRELQEAVDLVEELQAAALSDSKRTGRDFSVRVPGNTRTRRI